MVILGLIFTLVYIVSLYQIFENANESGISAVIPFYNLYTLFKITFGNGLKMLWLFVPVVNLWWILKVNIKLAKVFGKSESFGLGLLLLPVIFHPILAFKKNTVYLGIYR